MKKRIILTILIFSILAFVPFTSTADFPTGELGYSDEIAVGKEFEWTVSKLELSGDFASYTTRIFVGEALLNEGDIIKMVITDDPDTAVGAWYDYYVNNVLMVSKDIGDLLDYGMYYLGLGAVFISPATYTNGTGTYNLYEQLFEEFVENNDETAYSTTYTSGTNVYEFSVGMLFEFTLNKGIFTSRMEHEAYISETVGGYTESSHEIVRIKSSLNTQTGLLGGIDLFADFNLPGQVGFLHMIIDSDYDNTPYDWVFSFLGLTVIATVVGLIRRKRR